jgi:hypothetical protein
MNLKNYGFYESKMQDIIQHEEKKNRFFTPPSQIISPHAPELDPPKPEEPGLEFTNSDFVQAGGTIAVSYLLSEKMNLNFFPTLIGTYLAGEGICYLIGQDTKLSKLIKRNLT